MKDSDRFDVRRFIARIRRRSFKTLAGLLPGRACLDEPRGVTFGFEDIERLRRTYFETGGAPGSAWDPLRDAHLRLPDWFRHGLDPFSEEYLAQQHRLWRLVAGVDRDYEVEQDEKEADWGAVDAVRAPGFYVRRDAGAIASASDHVIASGMLLKHCGLQAGDRALEYGAGFGQTALALARLGVNVDTVDVSRTFCSFVNEQAEFFRVPLQAFQGRFGDAPRPGVRYKLVWFYESFHHCVDFQRVVRLLPDLLEPGGRVILGGEPIIAQPYAAVPYPWGLRLHSEVAAVVRQQRWFELGFTETFLFDLFGRAGFEVERIDCEPTLFGRLYLCHR
jgi:2-polyprenyl-3-methyl-5-hydroxy-6-metoxy-1,4-benzoquinol methylase